jgi:muconolactone delta-isomerase
MEYLTDLVTTVPEGTSPVKVDELRAAEAERAARSRRMAQHWAIPRLVTPSYLDEGSHYAAESASQ